MRKTEPNVMSEPKTSIDHTDVTKFNILTQYVQNFEQ